MKWNIILGIFISLLFICFAFWGISVSELEESFQNANYFYTAPIIFMVLLGLLLRSYRWGIIMESLVKYKQTTLFAITSIGFMAVIILPARLGEFARPYIVKQKSGIDMSSTIATVIVERIFDLFAITIFMFAVVLKISLPPVILKTGIITLTMTMSVFIVLIFLSVRKKISMNKIDSILSKNPNRFKMALNKLSNSFLDGLQILPDIKKCLYVSALSILLWTTLGLSAYILFFSFGFNLSVINAFAILIITAFGIMIPAGPGFVGTWHFACVLGLTYFGISKSEALSYAIVLHFLQMMPVIVLGVLFLPFQKISLLKFIRKRGNNGVRS